MTRIRVFQWFAVQKTHARGTIMVLVALLASVFVLAPAQVSQATGGAYLFYSWGQGTNAVSKMTNTTPVNTWASGSTGSGASVGVASDGTYIYWANGSKVYRQSVSASDGGQVSTFIDISTWAAQAWTINALTVDATHIYLGVWRNFDDNSILRADKSTGTQDLSWGKLGFGTSMYPITGIAADNNPHGYVAYSWVNYLGRVSKDATSGAPTIDEQTWTTQGVGAGSASDPTPLTSDGTNVYYRDGNEQVSKRPFADAAGNPGTQITQHIPASSGSTYSGKIRGIAYDATANVVYAVSSVATSNAYTIYSATADATSQTVIDNTQPGYFSTYATFSSTTGSVRSLVRIPIPAVAPTINTQPNNASVTAGQSATFSVSASVTDGGTLSYQWKKGGVDISGANSAAYVIGSTTSANAGTYSVVVTNTMGASTAATTSSSATLTVNAPVTTTTSTTTTVPASGSSSSQGSSKLVTAVDVVKLEQTPNSAAAIVNGQNVAVTVLEAPVTNNPSQLQQAATSIVSALDALTPAGSTNPVKVVKTSDGAELTGLLTNPDDASEKLNVPVEAVKLLKVGSNSAVLLAAMNQTNLPADLSPSGAIEVTRGGILAARAYGLGASENGEIVLMSTPRLLQNFTVTSSGTFSGQVPLPKDISFGSHTVVMATKNAKVSLGITLVRTKMQFRIKRVIGTTLFKNRAGVNKTGGAVAIKGAGRCKATNSKITMGSKPGACYITVTQAAKGSYKALTYRFTVSVVTKVTRKR